MKILWLTWKDHMHPDSGGAEVVLFELSKRLARDGHEVTWLTCGYDHAKAEEKLEGITIIRVGTNRYLHSFQALVYYVRHMRNKYDVVIEVVNTAPYFSVFFGRRSKRFLFYHQLARQIWFYETKPPLSQFGFYVFEPIATRLLSLVRVPVITVSKSSKDDLVRFGFQPDSIQTISEGIEMEPVKDLKSVRKYNHPTLLSLGSMRAMKQTLDQVYAFEFAKEKIIDLELKIAGDANSVYGKQVLETIKKSPYQKDIDYLGKVSEAEKIKLMQKSHIILQTAIKEGWGLTITEANSQGTPAIVYNVDGLRDSVMQNKTGIISENNPEALATSIYKLLKNKEMYENMRKVAWRSSKEITFDHSYKNFVKIVGLR